MKRFVVVENPPKGRGARSVPAFRPVVFSPVSRNKGKLTKKQIENLPYRSCISVAGSRRFKKAPRCRTMKQRKQISASGKARRLAGLAKARAVMAGKRVLTGYGSSTGSFQTNRRGRRNATFFPTTLLNRGGKKRKKARHNATFFPSALLNTGRSRLRSIFIAKSRRKSGSSTKSRRGGSANTGGRKMATAKQKAWRAEFARRARTGTLNRGRKHKKNRRTSRNKQGKALSGKVYRPSLPARRKVMKVIRKFRSSWKKAHKRRPAKKARKNRARRNPVYTVYNRPRKARKNRCGRKNTGRLTSARARAMSMRRWHKKSGKRKKGRKNGRRARRNFGGGFVAKLKEAFNLATVTSGLAVLAGAVVATGAPSLLGSWNSGWTGIGLSIAAAGLAGVLATYVAPKYLTEVASGGIVVVGLRLVSQFVPSALMWSSATGGALIGKGKTAGYYGVGRGTASGFLPPARGMGAITTRLNRGSVSGLIGGGAHAAGEGFRGVARI